MAKKLVAYFSASGVTKKVAEMISEVSGYDFMRLSLNRHIQRLT